jgi:tRNA(Leu) C34 or U34 (ribose-2'-O)-methylase TrmL
MKHQRSVHSVARVIAFVALNLVMIASVGAQRQEREATVAGRDVTIQVTVHPHNDRAALFPDRRAG